MNVLNLFEIIKGIAGAHKKVNTRMPGAARITAG
jgi:hypothetical protein